jgi:hypothetical protein
MGEMMMDVRVFANLKAQIDIQRNDLTAVSSLWIIKTITICNTGDGLSITQWTCRIKMRLHLWMEDEGCLQSMSFLEEP